MHTLTKFIVFMCYDYVLEQLTEDGTALDVKLETV